MATRPEKRWLKSVADPDLIGAFEDSEFDAGEYAKSFYEQREASQAARRIEKLEGLKRQTEYALREEVVRNYKAFMHATEEIRTMETGIQTLKDLMANTGATLETFRGVRLVETVKPSEKAGTGRLSARAATAGRGADGPAPDEEDGDVKGASASRGLKLPEWLDQAPIELEELLLERKHQKAANLIRRVRDFSSNVQNATNLGRGVEKIFQKVETMASGMADRLLAEINAANTLTVWGFREHKTNFALLIALGHGEQAAISFVSERSAMIRRSLRHVEVTADPLSYISVLSDTFFGQVYDAVTAFIKLFCKSARSHERRVQKSGKSAAFYQIYQGVRDSGTAPFCRLVVWVNQQIDHYAVLMGRQIRAVTMGPQRITREQSARKMGREASGSWISSGEDAGFRLGPVASSLFSIVSLMLEEGFAAAARLNTMGFPVGVQLASRLVPDVTYFLTTYVDSVKDNLVEAIRKDAFVSVECKLVRPEALFVCTPEEEEMIAMRALLTSSARILVLEARDILDYALVLLEPPPVEEEAFVSSGAVGTESEPEGQETASYYTRDEFLELEPVIVTSLDKLLRTYLKETMACIRARRDDLSTNQSTAVTGNLAEFGKSYVRLLADWCAELLPEIADEEEVTNLRSLKAEFQRCAKNPLRTRESSSSGTTRTSNTGRTSSSSSLPSSSKAPQASGTAAPAREKSSSRPPSHRSRGSTSTVSTAPSSTGRDTTETVKGSNAPDVAVRDHPSSAKTSQSIRTVTNAPAADSSKAEASSSSSKSSRSLPGGAAARDYPSSAKTSQSIRTVTNASAADSSKAEASSSSSKSSRSLPGTGAAASASGGKTTHTSERAATAGSSAPYTQGLRPSQIIAGPSGVQSSSGSSSASWAVSRKPSADSLRPSKPSPTKAYSEMGAAAAAAAAAAVAATAASSGRVVPSSSQGGGGSDSSGTMTKRPSLTLKAAREAREAKAKAAAEARATRGDDK